MTHSIHRRLLVPALALCCAAVASVPVQAQAPAAPPIDTTGTIDSLPPITVEPPVLDLGFMAPRAGGKGTVMLRNTGDKPLTISAVTPSCKCTKIGRAHV